MKKFECPRRDLNPCYRRERTKGRKIIQSDGVQPSVTKSNGHKGVSRIGNQRMSLSNTGGWHWFGTKMAPIWHQNQAPRPPAGTPQSRFRSHRRCSAINYYAKNFRRYCVMQFVVKPRLVQWVKTGGPGSGASGAACCWMITGGCGG